MKMLLSLAALTLAATAHAGTLAPLQSPPRVSLAVPAWECMAASFDASDNPHGYCAQQVTTSSGRSGVRYKFTTYATTWDIEGNVTSNVFCGTLYSPGPYQPAPVYASGYSATTCEIPTGNIGPFVLIYPNWYTVKAYSSDGAYEAVSGNAGPAIYAF